MLVIVVVGGLVVVVVVGGVVVVVGIVVVVVVVLVAVMVMQDAFVFISPIFFRLNRFFVRNIRNILPPGFPSKLQRFFSPIDWASRAVLTITVFYIIYSILGR